MAENGPVLELRVALTDEDVDAALRFYRDALGLPVEQSWEDANGKGVILAAGQATLELVSKGQSDYIDRIEAGKPVSGPVRLAMQVADSVGTAAKLEAAGGHRMAEAVTTPWQHRNVRLRTTEGLQLTLFTVPKI
jgi:lactoylglutathione lyase